MTTNDQGIHTKVKYSFKTQCYNNPMKRYHSIILACCILVGFFIMYLTIGMCGSTKFSRFLMNVGIYSKQTFIQSSDPNSVTLLNTLVCRIKIDPLFYIAVLLTVLCSNLLVIRFVSKLKIKPYYKYGICVITFLVVLLFTLYLSLLFASHY